MVSVPNDHGVFRRILVAFQNFFDHRYFKKV